MTIDPTTISQPHLHNYLLTAVAPRPIAFVSSIDKEGNVNLSPFSFFNVFSSNPPIMIFSPARSGRDGSIKHTLQNVLEVPEVTINIVNYPIVEQMSLASTAYPKGVNEFIKAGLTQVPSEKVKPPYVKEAPAAFECVVEQVIELGNGGGAGNLVLAKVVNMHFQEEYLDEQGFLSTEKLDLVGRMGGIHYNRASQDTLFEIPKPIRTQGIGIDQLPAHVRNSELLTGNNLGRLGNLERLPTPEEITALKKELANSEEINLPASLAEIHLLARTWIQQEAPAKALTLLMITDL